MSRLQLALNVSDLDGAVEFYSKLFDTSPAKRHRGYANFAIVDPPLKLVLIENRGREKGIAGALNHLGVEVEEIEAVRDASVRLHKQGLNPSVEHETTCCYALQDKTWVRDLDGAPWEIYTVFSDAPDGSDVGDGPRGCCTSEPVPSGDVSSRCC